MILSTSLPRNAHVISEKLHHLLVFTPTAFLFSHAPLVIWLDSPLSFVTSRLWLKTACPRGTSLCTSRIKNLRFWVDVGRCLFTLRTISQFKGLRFSTYNKSSSKIINTVQICRLAASPARTLALNCQTYFT